MISHAPLRILHVFRTPTGGLFRHVLDVARGQIERGHAVGLVCDSLTGGDRAAAALEALRPALALGLTRLPMDRAPTPRDLMACASVARLARRLSPDVVHGHGSKGGLYARLPAFVGGLATAVRVYTPHGGSFHYAPGTLAYRLYMGTEALLERRTDLLLFESAYVQERFRAALGEPRCLARVVRNGLSASEFAPVETRPDAVDVLYIGELRALKGVDTLIEALVLLRGKGRSMRALFVGAGPDEAALKAGVAARGLGEAVTFHAPMPIREALRRARVMVVPSRAESLPYVVLEAAAAGQPLVATHVGGIPEIFGPYADRLIAPDKPERLAAALLAECDGGDEARQARAAALRAFVGEHFSLPAMVDAVIAGYRDALSRQVCR